MPGRTPRPRPLDEGVPHLGGEAAETVGDDQKTRAAVAELVGLHGDVDASRATL